jgi:creatinine amidohydrolase/Fe(II)-dependent formamide hydrolase-like protein
MSDLHYSYRQLRQWLTDPGWHLALLPVGCYEQHGPELPLDTDILESAELARRLVVRVAQSGLGRAYCLPGLHYTPTEPNKDFAGTVSVAGDFFRPYLEAVLRGILATAYTGLVVVNGHGSVDPILKEVSFKLVLEQFESGVRPVRPILCLNVFDVWNQVESRFGQAPGRHADWAEMLMTYALLGNDYYDSNRLERLQEFSQTHDFSVRFPRVLGIPAQLRSIDGVQGQPWPQSSLPLQDQAHQYWTFVEDECFQVLRHELTQFQERFNPA